MSEMDYCQIAAVSKSNDLCPSRCFLKCVSNFGLNSFFQGVGALGLQYVLHLCFLRFIRTVIEYGNRAITIHPTHQQTAPLLNSSTHRMIPLHFDSSLPSTSVQSSALHADEIPVTSAGRFTP